MHRRPILSLLACASILTACSSNHPFAESRLPDGTPDFARLERALAEAQPNSLDERELSEVRWFPLVSLKVDEFKESPPGMLPGNTLTSLSGIGPLFMNGSSDEWRYDTGGKLYERRTGLYAAWGLYAEEDLEVRVPTGWRTQSRVSLLFGLLEWPSEGYLQGEVLPSVARSQ